MTHQPAAPAPQSDSQTADGVAALQRRHLPIGIQTFREIREEDHYYVDKTPVALRLVAEGKYYFLSRPRRFGKSLFLDTLKQLFEGQQALFTGLAAETGWDWSKTYPVLRFSFGGGVLGSVADLGQSLHQQLTALEDRFTCTARFPDHRSRFKDLIMHAAKQGGQRVVILVDEYDKPILDRIEEAETARQIREVLKDFYSVIKDSDEYLKFVFLTGRLQIQQSQPVFGTEQPQGHHARCALQHHLRLHRPRCGHRLCPRTTRAGP